MTKRKENIKEQIGNMVGEVAGNGSLSGIIADQLAELCADKLEELKATHKLMGGEGNNEEAQRIANFMAHVHNKKVQALIDSLRGQE